MLRETPRGTPGSFVSDIQGGLGSTKALNITTHCKGYVLPGVLIDNGSALNVLPLATLQRLPVDSSHIKPCRNSVRAFDGTQREAIGMIEIPLLIGPTEYTVEFVVMDITPTYNCLLGRPWIHSVGAVPSSLHQKLKFMIEGKLVCVEAERDIIASVTSDIPYVEANEEVVECAFRALEFVNAAFIAEGHRIPRLRLSNCTKMSVQATVGKGARAGRGLGKKLQGSLHPRVVIGKKDRFVLGFKPNFMQRNKEWRKKQERGRARLEGEDVPWEPMSFPGLKDTFTFGGIVNTERKVNEAIQESDKLRDKEMFSESLEGMMVNVVSGEAEGSPLLSGIRPCLPGETLNNWTCRDAPVTLRFKSESPIINCMNDAEPNPEIDGNEDEIEGEILEELIKLVTNEDKQLLPYQEELETLNLGTEEERKEVKIGTTLSDMPGLDTDIVVHKLPTRPDCKPVQQKLRRMRTNMLLKIREEVQKQLDAGFLKVAKYPEWVANIVPVPKKDGKVRMCVDYRDLNKASSKDNFPLPHIDTLVDNTAGHSWFSFMDGFSGYNQIRMHPEDMEKSTFITMWGTFYYKVMPFGLKNAGATYQRAMVTLFHDMMHMEIEVYVDDMIAKSQTEEEHVQNLRKLFQRLRKYRLRLNPAKCTFAVTFGKLLGFIVSRNGIEIDPDKVKTIQDLSPPQTQKEVRVPRRLNYISRFISQLTNKCDPIFKLLRKNNPGVWDDECQTAFEKIKKYLTNAPVLVAPTPGRPLILYLTVYEESMGCVLGQHDESGKNERAIYYLSKKFTSCETRYPPIQKLCCALIWATKRLMQYMLYHTTWLISKLDPLKFLMEAPTLTGRTARSQMLLSEFDIMYVSQKAIKGSAIAYFLARRASVGYEPLNFDFPDEDLMCVMEEEEGSLEPGSWRLYFDGASNAIGRGIGAVLISPENVHYPFTSILEFISTNNMAEYKARVLGLRAAIERKIKELQVFGDSSIVIYQLRGDWETRDLKLIKYYDLVQELNQKFDKVSFNYLPREEN
ncbi:hypothetical protein V6N13_048531 [Hibiscus sabdariffa]